MKPTPTFRAIAAAICLLSAGCNRRTGDQVAAPPMKLDLPEASPPIRIVATETGFEFPDTIPAGLRHFVYENRGSGIHEAMLIKLAPNSTPADFAAEVQGGTPFPKGALDYSGPGLMSPGEKVETWLRVDPGKYVLFCWNDPKSNHFRGFEVTSAAPDDRPPKEDVVVRLADYRFEFQGTLKKGAQVIRFENLGPSMHEADLFRFHEGKSGKDLIAWRKLDDNGPAPPAPVEALGGVLDSHDIRRIVWARRNFVPGRYALMCEMPMPAAQAAGKTGMHHTDLGMLREFEIQE